MIYNTNGIITEKPVEDTFWIAKSVDNFILSDSDFTHEIESECHKLYDIVTVKIFGSLESYYSILKFIPSWIKEGGIDAEMQISKHEFEQNVTTRKGNADLFKILYFYDCRNLIASIQNANIESKFIFGEFYKQLNENDFLVNKMPLIRDGVQYSSGLIVTNIFSSLNYLFVCLYSILDFTTKLCFELENMATDFSKYPKLKSNKKTFGDHKRISFIDKSSTIFEQSEKMSVIVNVRNEIVHNSTIDNLPKVYQSIENGEVVEKFILFPDFENGNLLAYQNRKRFFYKESKINEILPDLMKEFWNRMYKTLERVVETCC